MALTPFSDMRAQSSDSVHTQWAAMARTSHTPYLSKVRMGEVPQRALHSACSRFVSEMCTCIPRPWALAKSAVHSHRPGWEVYSPWMEASTRMRPLS